MTRIEQVKTIFPTKFGTAGLANGLQIGGRSRGYAIERSNKLHHGTYFCIRKKDTNHIYIRLLKSFQPTRSNLLTVLPRMVTKNWKIELEVRLNAITHEKTNVIDLIDASRRGYRVLFDIRNGKLIPIGSVVLNVCIIFSFNFQLKPSSIIE